MVTIPPPLLVTVPPVSIAACIGGPGLPTAFCQGTSTVTVRNLGLIATSVTPVLSVTGTGATIDQGTCASGVLAAGATCTATLSIKLTVPTGTIASSTGTVSAIAGAAAGRANYTTTS